MWACLNPAIGTYAIKTTPSVGAGQDVAGASFYIVDASGVIQQTSSVPRPEPISVLLQGNAVQSIEGLTGVVPLSSTGATINITTVGNTINLDVAGTSGGTMNFFGYPWGGTYGGGSVVWSGAYLANGTANVVPTWSFYLPLQISAKTIYFYVSNVDSTNSYDIGIYNLTGTLVAHTGALPYTSGGVKKVAFSGGPIVLNTGSYYFSFTTSSGSGSLGLKSTSALQNIAWTLDNTTSGAWLQSATASSSSVLPGTITPPTLSTSVVDLNSNDNQVPYFALSSF
jgi:hypothetical protein